MCVPPFPPGWNELLIASFSHRSISVKDGILLATGLHVHRNSAHSAGVGAIFDRWGGPRGLGGGVVPKILLTPPRPPLFSLRPQGADRAGLQNAGHAHG